jgi:hypothetical protein
LTTPEGRMGKEKFKSTKERLVKRSSSWAKKNMSSGAKEILIKFVPQAIPTRYGQRKIHWIAWEKC